MSNWNPQIGQVMMTTATDVMTAVNAERAQVKVGHPCTRDQSHVPLSSLIFGSLESVTTEVIWNGHQRLPDLPFQHYILRGRHILSETEMNKLIFSDAGHGWVEAAGGNSDYMSYASD